MNTKLLNTPNQNDLTFELLNTVEDKNQVVGFFQFLKTKTITVLDNGSLLLMDNNKVEDLVELKLPFNRI